jgi:hypothetical protein
VLGSQAPTEGCVVKRSSAALQKLAGGVVQGSGVPRQRPAPLQVLVAVQRLPSSHGTPL